jgi:hypothetical protein
VSGSANDAFRLPSATDAITPDTMGMAGYSFEIVTFPGNVTLYVIAGLEDRSDSPPRFVPYAMGVARGISVPTQTRVTGVDVKMDILFDHQVTLGASGFAIFPNGSMIVPYPAPATMPFVGVPSLDHAIAGEQYVLGGVAATGADLQEPASVVSRVRTTNANDPVVLGGFLGVPVLGEPAGGAWSGTHVAFTGASGPVDLAVVEITSGGGLVTWRIAAPGGVTSFDVPDLGAINSPDHIGLLPGPISTSVHVARIEAFSYGRIRQGQLGSTSWNAHAFDTLSGAY